MAKQHSKLNKQDFNVMTKVYDVEKKQLIGMFQSQLAAAKFLGVSQGLIRQSLIHKSRIYKNKLGIVACIR